jgi:CIC family chloride channel protein
MLAGPMSLLTQLRPNVNALSAPGGRFRVLIQRRLGKLGFGDDAFLLIMAVLIGTITGAAAVGFHELTNLIRDQLYKRPNEEPFLYGHGMWLLVLLPAAGGLAVGVVSRYVFRAREGHGVVDVMESVVRTSGFQRPAIALEKTLTSALTLGSGGSTGAEGPIVQIGAAIASGVGQMFRVARSAMPILTGCGTAAGISAIFNAPFGGVLFTLEVILQDFSIRSFTPVVLASVIAQVTTQGIFQVTHHPDEYRAIFNMPAIMTEHNALLTWQQVGNFVLLGLVCGGIGAAFIRLMNWSEHLFAKLTMPRFIRPAFGGALLGVIAIVYLMVYGHHPKPFAYQVYPMPAFFGDGYGVIQQLLDFHFYADMSASVTLLLVLLCGLKMLGTSITLGSGGSGGVIAPALFAGATVGSVVGHLLGQTHWFPGLQPQVYALVGMGAVLAAVVHAPMASILICFELTRDYQVMLPAMLGCIIAVAVARIVQPDSIYTQSLRMRGVNMGTAGDHVLLRRITVEQVPLDPVSIVGEADPMQHLLDLSAMTSTYEFVVADALGRYEGMVLGPQLGPVLMDREAIPVLVARDVMRVDVPPVRTTDDLAAVFDAFSQHDVTHLPVCVPQKADHIIGLISRAAVIRRYQEALKGE